VLVADIGMPGRDGYDLIALVRAMEVGRDHRLPALALTACAADGDRRRVLMSGFDSYLTKPATPEMVTAAVARLAGW
jgi:CheY-like chemotaxis protein